MKYVQKEAKEAGSHTNLPWFDYIEFDDYYGQHCSLQKSSLMEPNAIWLGVKNTGPNLGLMYGDVNQKNVDVHCRMHLSQEQVKQLLPFLVKFAKTGQLS